MRKNVGMALGMMFLGALTACDNNPLEDGRDEALYIYTDPSFATIMVGDTIKVQANVMNKFLAPTGDAVTATPCDAKLTATADTSRTEFEQPERFVVAATGIGSSCLVVSGGGVSDTVGFLIGPAAVAVTTTAALASGGTAPLAVTFQNTAGTTVPGLTISDVTFLSRTPTVVFIDTVTNEISGRAPGSAWVVTTLRTGRGAVVRDSVLVTVSAGAFTGTLAGGTLTPGSVMTLNAGGIPFDADTRVTVNGSDVWVISNTPTAITFVAPVSSGTTANFVVANMGPNQIAAIFSQPMAAETQEPDEPAGAERPLVLGQTYYGTVSDGADFEDWYVFTVPATQTVDIVLNWAPGTTATSDVDAYIIRPSGSQPFTGCGTSAKPEHCAGSVAAGTYYVIVQYYADGTTVGPLAYALTVKTP